MTAATGITVTRTGVWAGLPDAEELAALDKLHPGLGERAFKVVERQQIHEHRARWAGLITSFILAAASLAASVYFIAHGNTLGGASLSFTSAAGIVTTYMSRLLGGSGGRPEPRGRTGATGTRS